MKKRTACWRAAATHSYVVAHNLIGGGDAEDRTLDFVGSAPRLEVLCAGKVMFVKASNVGEVEAACNRKGNESEANLDDWVGRNDQSEEQRR